MAERTRIKISNTKEFGAFCEILTREGVDFSHMGFYSIGINEDTLKNLPIASRNYLKKLQEKKHIMISELLLTGKRAPLPTSEQAGHLLKKLTKKMRRRGIPR